MLPSTHGVFAIVRSKVPNYSELAVFCRNWWGKGYYYWFQLLPELHYGAMADDNSCIYRIWLVFRIGGLTQLGSGSEIALQIARSRLKIPGFQQVRETRWRYPLERQIDGYIRPHYRGNTSRKGYSIEQNNSVLPRALCSCC